MRSTSDNDAPDYQDIGDRAKVKEGEKKAKALEERRIDGLRQILSTPNGRLWMWKFLEGCGMWSTAFNGNSKDYFNLGQRNAGMPIFVEIQNKFTDLFLLMIKENSNVQA